MKGQTMNRYDFYKLAAEIADWNTVTFKDADKCDVIGNVHESEGK